MAPNTLSCPFCDFNDADEYFLMLHIEELHTDDSPFVSRGAAAANGDESQLLQPPNQQMDRDDLSEQYVDCPESDCGEQVLLSDLNEHLDLHLAERVTLEEQHDSSSGADPEHTSSPAFIQKHFSTAVSPYLRHAVYDSPGESTESMDTPSKSKRDREEDSRRRKRARRDHDERPVRLGKRELGPHAFEERMPDRLWKQLMAGPKITKTTKISRNGTLITQETVENETAGLVPVLAQLSSSDRDVHEAFYCNPAVLHIFSSPNEGGFCGYRNIQMLVSYLQGAKAPGYDKFTGRTPGIPKLQDAIEQAWDKGIGAFARQQTGGIKGTRKYIGTPEVFALFRSLDIPCTSESFHDMNDGHKAYENLLDNVESYFTSAVPDQEEDKKTKVHRTGLPPIYLQRPQHSLTIVGLEKRRNGSRNLVVFDPMYKTTPALVKLLGRSDISLPHSMAMESCRRWPKNLARYDSFEIFKLTGYPPRFPTWDV
ncbi:DUF1671-domain-containing protein [Rhizodiscina lignyota]|uniref:DUF1671-domain-containing protein n=1 Tax=Rhizodiscina lignyota TaxID=1504668 RepID=A0A9P4I969_9PEZI|nr:DUF1671-domain-containing protein [Rhizodiscina lignyota]